MNFDGFSSRRLVAVLLGLALAGCASFGAPESGQDSLAAVIGYHQSLGRMSAGEQARQRSTLGGHPVTPANQVRLAMLLATPRQGAEYGRAIGLLEGVLKSSDAQAVALHPLARLLAEQYGERQRLDGLLDRQAQQLKESQRQTAELQEKLDSLADIERTLSSRPGSRGGRK